MQGEHLLCKASLSLKEQPVTDTPLLVFDCVLANGQTESWSTHKVTVGTTTYAARVVQHSSFDIQTASDQGVDGSPKISLVLANADSHFSEIERATGWKGAKLTVGIPVLRPAQQRAVDGLRRWSFRESATRRMRTKESTFRLTATNRMNLQRLLLPQVRIQRRCPWEFPATREPAGRGGERRGERQVLALLPLRLFGRADGRTGKLEQRRAVHFVRVHAARIARRAACRRASAGWSSCRRRSPCAATGRTGPLRPSR